MSLIIKWVVDAAALFLIGHFVAGVTVASFPTALIVVFVLGIVNITIRPFLILLTLPITILTLGLFTFVINALLFWFVASFVKGFDVAGFWPAFLGALLFTLVSMSVSHLIRE